MSVSKLMQYQIDGNRFMNPYYLAIESKFTDEQQIYKIEKLYATALKSLKTEKYPQLHRAFIYLTKFVRLNVDNTRKLDEFHKVIEALLSNPDDKNLEKQIETMMKDPMLFYQEYTRKLKFIDANDYYHSSEEVLQKINGLPEIGSESGIFAA